MASYIAVIHKDPDSDFGVSFPDFPDCITAGATIDEGAYWGRCLQLKHNMLKKRKRELGEYNAEGSQIGRARHVASCLIKGY